MFYWYKLDPDDNVNINFENLFKKAISLFVAKKKWASLVQFEKEGQRVENSVEKCDYKTCISFTLNYLIAPTSVMNYYPLNFLATTFVQTSDADYWLVYKKINHLIEIIKGLALLFLIL